jgi:hypothetical protein
VGEAQQWHLPVCDAEGAGLGGDWGEGWSIGMNRWLVFDVKNCQFERKLTKIQLYYQM